MDPNIFEYLLFFRRDFEKCGIWPFASTKRRYILKICLAFLLDAMTIVNIWAEISRARQADDIIMYIDVMMAVTVEITGIMKCRSAAFGRGKLRKIIYLLDDLFKTSPVAENDAIKKDLIKKRKQIIFIAKFFDFISYFIYAMYVVNVIRIYLQTGVLVYPRPSSFGENTNSILLYCFLFVSQTIVLWRIRWIFIADAFAPALVFMICSRIDILAETMKTSIEEQNLTAKSMLFKKGVIYHQKILR